MNDKKELIKRTFICVLLVVLCYFAVFFIVGTRNVHDNGYRIDKVRNELTNAETTQREETRVIDETEKAISRSQKGIDESTKTNKSIEKLERKDAEIIAECQSILARIRERATSKD